MIASTKGDAFYRGDLAERIEAHAGQARRRDAASPISPRTSPTGSSR